MYRLWFWKLVSTLLNQNEWHQSCLDQIIHLFIHPFFRSICHGHKSRCKWWTRVKKNKASHSRGKEAQRNEWVIFLIQRGISPAPCSSLIPRLENSPPCVFRICLAVFPESAYQMSVGPSIMKIKAISAITTTGPWWEEETQCQGEMP